MLVREVLCFLEFIFQALELLSRALVSESSFSMLSNLERSFNKLRAILLPSQSHISDPEGGNNPGRKIIFAQEISALHPR